MRNNGKGNFFSKYLEFLPFHRFLLLYTASKLFDPNFGAFPQNKMRLIRSSLQSLDAFPDLPPGHLKSNSDS